MSLYIKQPEVMIDRADDKDKKKWHSSCWLAEKKYHSIDIYLSAYTHLIEVYRNSKFIVTIDLVRNKADPVFSMARFEQGRANKMMLKLLISVAAADGLDDYQDRRKVSKYSTMVP
ncbi:hypothetical protein RRG08_008399 [Elysia crispata]|uniref:Uncharacterized protein n=1 Tax=Elysia crispata TaxID=231223 RepID=A0AAE1BCX5_9GAST|nr:hypothetical protein RRG08_008399 [Elysia crispata]